MGQRGNFVTGIRYLSTGMSLLRHPKLRGFVLIPLLINIVLFIGLTTLYFQRFEDLLAYFMGFLPDFLEFLAWIVTILVGLLVLIIYGYGFSLLTNLIAAPFYGLLAEKTERHFAGGAPSDESFLAMIPRTLSREVIKFWYFLWRSLLILILSFIPPIGPFVAALWATWCMGIQYGDYAADNHQTPFRVLRMQLKSRLWTSLGFGGAVTLGMMIPVLNIFIMPAAVIGGTLFWCRELQQS